MFRLRPHTCLSASQSFRLMPRFFSVVSRLVLIPGVKNALETCVILSSFLRLMTLQIEGMRGAGSAQKRTINEMEERGREREKALAADVAALQAEASQRNTPLS